MGSVPFDLFVPDKTALLVIDKQNAYMDQSLLSQRSKTLSPEMIKVLQALDAFIGVARQHNVPIIWTQMTEDLDVSPLPIKQKMQYDYNATHVPATAARPGKIDYELTGSVKPQSNELVIPKDHYDAFSNPALIQYLKGSNITSIILVGGFASRCVLGTAYGANNHDLHVLVLKDVLIYPEQFQKEFEPILSIIDGILGYTATTSQLIESWQN